MPERNIETPYARLILFKRMPLAVFWGAVAITAFIGGEILFRTFHEPGAICTQLVFAFFLIYGPVVHAWLLRRFEAVVRQVGPLLWDDQAESEAWLQARLKRCFTFSSWPAISVTGIIVALGVVSVLVQGKCFNSTVLYVAAVSGFMPVLLICAHAGYVTLDLLATLKELGQRKPNVPFFMLPHPAITALQAFYSGLALSVTLGYAALAVALWRSPFGLSPTMQAWLLILSFYPISTFGWSFYQTHVLMREAKLQHLVLINAEVQRCLSRTLNGGDIQSIERLQKIMEVQRKSQATREWPFDIQNSFALLIALAAATAQILSSAIEFAKR